MKNFATCTAAGNLVGMRWNSFQVTTSNTWKQINATNFAAGLQFAVNQFSSLFNAGAGFASEFRFTITGGGVVPAWIQPGVGVTLAGTIAAGDIFSGTYCVKAVAADGTYFDVTANKSVSSVVTAAVITGGTCTLIIQCQKAMLSVLSGESNNISIAPAVDVNGSAGYVAVLNPGGAEYEITAPSPSPISHKFDLGDWWVKADAATPKLSIRFI